MMDPSFVNLSQGVDDILVTLEYIDQNANNLTFVVEITTKNFHSGDGVGAL